MAAKTKTPRWTPSPLDALNLAALRFYTLRMEQVCISIYASDRNHVLFPKVEKLLAKNLKALERLGRQTNVRSDIDCADGYVLCDDGLCHPPGTCS